MATLEQTRRVELVTGARQRFVITSLMSAATIPAQLPHLNVFVMKIVTRADPQDDTFQRVARIADLTTLPQGRPAGLASDAGTSISYLSPVSELGYDTLTEAVTASTAIKDRVNALVNDWITYKTLFDAPIPTPAVYSFPATDETQVETLIATYKTAKQDRYQKTVLKDAADAALVLAEADYTYKKARVTEYTTLVTKGVVVDTDVSASASFLGALIAAGTTFLGVPMVVMASAVDDFQAALNLAITEQSIQTSYDTDVSALNALLSANLAARVAEEDDADTALAAAKADQISKEQAWASALTTEATALAAVLAVCPDFVKNSVPFVDDDEA